MNRHSERIPRSLLRGLARELQVILATLPIEDFPQHAAGSFNKRRFFLCPACGLISVPAEDHLGADEERSRYALHDNDADNDGYNRYLGELVQVIINRGPAEAVLDFGCGRSAVLTGLLNVRGYCCTAYDPLYGIGADAVAATYDRVILSEVIEHVRDLPGEIALLGRVARRSGEIVVRTKLYPSVGGFAGWWYKNDTTHINFFSHDAMEVLAERLGRRVEIVAPDIFVLVP
jgi:hypothetical protein